MYLFIYVSVYLSVHLSIYLSLSLSVFFFLSFFLSLSSLSEKEKDIDIRLHDDKFFSVLDTSSRGRNKYGQLLRQSKNSAYKPGKSTLLTKVTGTFSEVGAYEFTTLTSTCPRIMVIADQ